MPHYGLYSEGSFWGPRGRHRQAPSMAAPDAPPYKQVRAMFMDSALPSMARNQDKEADAASKYQAAKELGELYEVSGLEVPSPQELLEAIEGPSRPEPGSREHREAARFDPGRARARGVLQKQRTRRAAVSAAREAVEGGDAETLSRLLGRDVRDTGETGATDEGAPIQKVWNVGGRRVLQQQLVTEAVAAAGRRAGEVMRGKADVGYRARLGAQLPAAKPKPKPVKLEPMTGAVGIYVDEAKLAEIQRTGGDPQDAVIDLSPTLADPGRVERRRTIARAAGGKPAEIFTETYIPGFGYIRVDEKGKATVIQKAPARWRLSGAQEVDGKTKQMWIPEPGQRGPDGKPLKAKVAWEEKLPVVGPEKDEIKGWEFDPATKKYVATLIETADGKPTGVTTRIGGPGFRPAGWGAPPSVDKAAYEVSFREITQKDAAGKEVKGDAPVVEWLDKKTGQVRISRGDILALKPEQAIQIGKPPGYAPEAGAGAGVEAGGPQAAPAFDFISDDRLEGNTSAYLNEYSAELEALAAQGDERAQAQLERIKEIVVERVTRKAGKGK